MYPDLNSRENFCTLCDNWVLITLIDISYGLIWFSKRFLETILNSPISERYENYSMRGWLWTLKFYELILNQPDKTSSAISNPHAETCFPSPQLSDQVDFQLTNFLHF